MTHDDDFRGEVLRELLSSELSSHITAEDIHPQVRLEEGGCPDIVIRTQNLLAFIEVKLNPRRELTQNQELNVGKELSGYLRRRCPELR